MNKPITDNRLKISYCNDYNIIDLQNRISNLILAEEKDKIPELQKQINSLRQQIKPSTADNKKRLILAELIDLQLKIDNLSSANQSFLDETKELINKYKLLGGHKTKKIVFGVKDNSTIAEDKERSEYRQLIIIQFLKIASKYIPINIHHIREINLICQCGQKFEDDDTGSKIKDSELVCTNCGLIYHLFIQSDVCESSSSDYEERENFVKEIIRFEGKEKIDLPNFLFTTLDNYFKSLSLPTGEEIRQMPLIKIAENRESRRGTKIVGKRLLRKALHDTELNSYYENINLIAHKYWGWELPDISKYIDKLLNHYDKTQAVFVKIKGKKKASLNNSWRLCQHLKIVGFNVRADDFNISEDRNILEYYDGLWSKMCKESGDPEIRYIRSI